MTHTERPRRAEKPFDQALPELLTERGLSLRELSRRAAVDVAHLSRVARREGGREVSAELAKRIATALDLPVDFFIETRAQRVLDVIRSDIRELDRVCDLLGL